MPPRILKKQVCEVLCGLEMRMTEVMVDHLVAEE